jgi:choice-of-anchor B domain-containing protein
VYVGDLPMHEGSRAQVWRDIKVYENHAFVVADNAGEHGMQVFDLTKLRDVAASEMPVTFEETSHYNEIHSAHNVVINEDTGFAYVVGSSGGGKTCGGGLHMVNIQNPAEPQFAGCFADKGTGRTGSGYTHDAQCVVYQGPDEEYQGDEICLGANETAISIANVSDKENPVSIATASYPDHAYVHQGWLTEDHRYFYVNDELDEINNLTKGTRTLIWDVSDLDNPQLVGTHRSTEPSTDHNLYVKGETMYQSNYVSGLRVLDVSNPTEPQEVGYLDTVPYGDNGPGFGGTWSNYPFFESGKVVVSSMQEGLFILRKSKQEL